MNLSTLRLAFVAAATAAAFAAPARAQVRVTEVAPWSSGNAPIAADWFEVTNFGASAVNITGWKFDDNSNAFGSSVALNGITSIAAGESVIFLESTTSLSAAFKTEWFGASAPAALQVGYYSGSGVGLSTGGDAVNLFNAAGVLQANVIFGASSAVPSLATFDNSSGSVNNGTITALSIVGVNGAFLAANPLAGNTEIGSPGRVSAVPEVSTLAMIAAGLCVVGSAVRRRQR
jgi:hypothetical protein